MDINNYSQIVSNVTDTNTAATNAKNALNALKQKIPDQIGDILTAEGSREMLNKVLTPLAQKALQKVGLVKEDVNDIINGKFRKVALKRLKQKLGLKSKAETEEGQNQRNANRQTEPVRNRGGQPASQEDSQPGKGIQSQPRNNTSADDDPVVDSTEEGRALNTALKDEDSFNDFVRNSGKFPDFANSTDTEIENARQQLAGLSSVDTDSIAGNVLNKLPVGENLLQDVNNPISSTANNLLSLGESEDTPFLFQTPKSLGRIIPDPIPGSGAGAGGSFSLGKLPTNLPIDENLTGSASSLVDTEGGNIKNLISRVTGSSSGSGDGSLSDTISRTIKNTGDDEEIGSLTDTLLAGVGETAGIPIAGEFLAPLLSIGAGLATLFGSESHKASAPLLNPSYQFL